MNNFDYPWGSDNSDAPWNQGDEPMKECPTCEGCENWCSNCEESRDDCECGEEEFEPCPECGGTGEVPMTDEDIQAEKDYYADMRMDEERLND